MKRNTIRICYFTGSEEEFANNAEKQRLEDLKKRRGVELVPRRQVKPRCVENFDEVIMIGNEYSLDTYKRKYNLSQTYLVPNTGYDIDVDFTFAGKDSCSFLWFGSTGCVHKGLDLLLEIFSEKKYCNEMFSKK